MQVQHRSPRYPSMDIESAIVTIRTLFSRVQEAEFPIEVLLQILGHQSKNGASTSKIGSLKQYGLLENPSKEVYQLTPIAVKLAETPESSADFQPMVSQIAYTPPILDEINRRVRTSSDETIISYLYRNHRFTKSAAKRLVSAYRRSEAFLDGTRLHQSFTAAEPIEAEGQLVSKSVNDSPQPSIENAGSASNEFLDADLNQSFSFLLRSGLVATVTLTGTPFDKVDIDVLKAYLDVLSQAVTRERV